MEALSELSILFDRENFHSIFGMNNQGILVVLLGISPKPGFLEMVSD
jgi:hypothetical protein